MLSPIVIFVYNRPDKTKQLIESLAKNPEASESEIFIFSDGPKNEAAFAKVKLVRNYIALLPKMNLFKSVCIRNSDSNKGLATSIISGVSEIMETYGKAIVVEDDNVVAPDFLDYMNRALAFYENDNKIWSVGAYSRKMKFPEEYKEDVFVMQRTSSYAWGSWKNRWDLVDWNTDNYYPAMFWNRKMRKAFDFCGADRSYMLDSQACGKKNSWAIRFEYSMVKNNMYSVLPVISRTDCTGNDGSGTHSNKETHKYDSFVSNGSRRAVFKHLSMNEEIRKEYTSVYKNSWKRKIFKNIDYIVYYYVKGLNRGRK